MLRNTLDLRLLALTLLGTGLVIASACVINNYIDRRIDARMARTQARGFVTGDVGAFIGLSYGAVLGLGGFTVLAVSTNWLTFGIGVLAYFAYIVVYGLAKRRSVHGTLVGTVAGALPPVAGYTAVSGQLDLACALIFIILVFWQMPHFYSIAIYRLADYKAAGLPVSPIVRGVKQTKTQIMSYIVGFILACAGLTLAGYTGVVYLFTMSIVGCIWLLRSYEGYKTEDSTAWARRNFRFSLIVILTLSVMLPVGGLLP